MLKRFKQARYNHIPKVLTGLLLAVILAFGSLGSETASASPGSWSFSHPSITKATLYGVWGNSASNVYAGVTLNAADLAILGYNSDGASDDVAIIALADIPAGTVIFITDNGWNSSTGGFTSGGENIITWTTPAITAGTIVNANSLPGSQSGVIATLGTFGDQILIYQTVDDTPTGSPTVIYAFNNRSTTPITTGKWQQTTPPASQTNDSNLPAGTTEVTSSGGAGNAFGLMGHSDNMIYVGPTTAADKATWLSRIHTPANWSTSNSVPQDISPGGTYLPLNVTVSSTTGTIEIINDTVPDGPQDFSFGYGPWPASGVPLMFQLDDDTDGALPNMKTFSNVTPGAYRAALSADANYATTISCVDPTNNTTIGDPDVEGLAAFIDVAAGETVTCTFENSLVYDLALKKVAATGPFRAGDPVTFTITISNQGAVDAFDIDIIDYVPSRTSYTSSNAASVTTSDNGNPVVVSDNGGGLFEVDTLAAGDSVNLDVILTIDSNFSGISIRNWAEIQDASDIDGGATATDVDSTPNGTNFNETGETNDLTDDDVTDEDGKNGGDEDDHDPAEIAVTPVFDLALRKTRVGPATILPGDDVTFTITITNQGVITAVNIQLADYIPAGFSLSPNDTNNWAPPGGTGTVHKTIPGILIPNGASTSTNIVLRADGEIAAGAYTNTAEISGYLFVGFDDIDSTPDQTNGNGPGETTNLEDDQIDEDAIANPATDDEDDHDIATVDVIVPGPEGTRSEIVNGDLVVTLPSAGGTNFAILLDGGNVVISDSVGISNLLFSSITGDIIVNGSSNDDRLTVDFSGGSPIPTGSVLIFDGGGEQTAAGDSLVMQNMGTRDSIVYDYKNLSDGTLVFGNQFSVEYRDLEPIFVDATALSATLVLTDTDDTATLTDLGSGMSRLDGTTFETTDFANPVADGLLRFELGAGKDELHIDSLALNPGTELFVDGEAGDDSVVWDTSARIHTSGVLSATFNADFVINFGADFQVVISGTVPGISYDRIWVNDPLGVVIGNNVTLAVSFVNGFMPSVGDSFTIIENVHTLPPIFGTFDGLAEGDALTVDGVTMTISYGGGPDTNDLILTVTSVPADGVLGGLVWNDIDSSGTQNGMEPALESATLFVRRAGDDDTLNTADDVILPDAVVDASGRYTVENLPADEYLLTFDVLSVPVGLEPISGNDRMTVTLGASEVITDVDVPLTYIGKAAVGNYVWEDENGNGDFASDTSEAEFDGGIDGVTMMLWLEQANAGTIDPADDLLLDITTTGNDASTTGTTETGWYSFEVAADGVQTFWVSVGGTNFDPSGALDGYTQTSGSDGRTLLPALSAGGDDTVDFGYAQTGDIGDFVWYDTDGDGEQDTGEPGIPSVVVSLTLSSGSIITTETDANGIYSFDDRLPGDYTAIVGNGIPVNAVNTTGADSQSSPYALTLSSGQDVDDADFGYDVPTSYVITHTNDVINEARAGEEMEFTVVITNTGGSWITSLPVRYYYDERIMRFESSTPTPDVAADDGELDWSDLLSISNSLAPGDSIQIVLTFKALRDPGTLNGNSTTNTVETLDGWADPDGPATVSAAALAPAVTGPLGSIEPVDGIEGSGIDSSVVILASTGVQMVSSSVTQTEAGTLIRWATNNELRVRGFHLLRESNGQMTQLNSEVIVAQSSGQVAGGSYEYTDTETDAGATYWLDVEGIDGSAERVQLGSSGSTGDIFLPLITR